MERLSWVLEGVASGAPALITGTIAFAYGVGLAWLIGVRSWLLAAGIAIPTAIALIAASAQLVGMVGIAAPVTLHAIGGAVLAASLGVLTSRWRRAARVPLGGPESIVWIGVAVGTIVTLGVWAGAIGNHALPPQANDDIWHGYLAERLTQMPVVTAETVAPTRADASEPTVFYQYGLHIVWGVVHAATGISLAHVLNGGWTVYIALSLPLGAAALAWRLFADRPWIAFWAASVAPGVVVLPYLTNGLLPYTAALTMIPGFLAVFVTHARGESPYPGIVPAAAAVGIFLAHPSAAIVGAILAGSFAIEVFATRDSLHEAFAALRRVAATGLTAGLVALPWLLAASDRGLGDLATAAAVPNFASAVALVATLGSPWTSPQPLLAIFVLVGIGASLVARRGVALVAGWGILAVLFIGAVTAMPEFTELTQVWHGHWYRLAAAMGVVVPVLAAVGVVTVIRWARTLASGRGMRRYSHVAIAAVVVMVSVGAAYGAAQGQSIVRTARHTAALVQASDVALYRELASLTGPGDRVFNSPRDGSSWMYALFEVVPMHAYIYRTPRWSWDLVNGLGRYADPVVACARLAHEDVTHAVVKEVTGNVPGLEAYDIAGFVGRHPDLFVELARSQSAVAYEIDRDALARCIGR